MKTFNLSLFIASFFTLSTPVQARNIFDIDGVGVETNYSKGPVATISTFQRSARTLGFHITYNNTASSCEYANLYSRENNNILVNTQVVPSNYTDYVNYAFMTDLPEANFTDGKLLELSCTDENNQSFTIHHKVPGIPKVTWEATVSPAGNFIYNSHYYSYHDSVAYEGKIIVSNDTTESICKSVTGFGPSLNLFHGKSSHSNFFSDVFTQKITFSNDRPILSQGIECSNSAGTTKIIKQWELTEEQSINLITEEVSQY